MYDTTKPYKKQILELISQTWETPYISCRQGIINKKFLYPEEADSADGLGTKGIYHWQQKTFRNAVIDALAMNLNDLLLMRATPYKLQNHILVPEDDKKAILDIVESFVIECKKIDIVVSCGETAIHDNIYGMEISVVVNGFIKSPKLNLFLSGDVLIGIKSSGLHSNGFTKIREIFKDESRKEFTEPTKIYSDEILSLDEKFDLHGMCHITGGAYTKLKEFLRNNDAVINFNNFKPQNIFYGVYDTGKIRDEEMYKTFNCGIGFVLSVSKKDADKIVSELNETGLESLVIGEVALGDGKVKINSVFSKREIVL